MLPTSAPLRDHRRNATDQPGVEPADPVADLRAGLDRALAAAVRDD